MIEIPRLREILRLENNLIAVRVIAVVLSLGSGIAHEEVVERAVLLNDEDDVLNRSCAIMASLWHRWCSRRRRERGVGTARRNRRCDGCECNANNRLRDSFKTHVARKLLSSGQDTRLLGAWANYPALKEDNARSIRGGADSALLKGSWVKPLSFFAAAAGAIAAVILFAGASQS